MQIELGSEYRVASRRAQTAEDLAEHILHYKRILLANLQTLV